MRTTGIFTVHSMKVPLASSAVPLTIVPFGDVHDGSPFHAAAEWDRDLREALVKDEMLIVGLVIYLTRGRSSNYSVCSYQTPSRSSSLRALSRH